MSYLSHLECSECGQTHNAHELHNLCLTCGAPLWARYDLDRARRELDRDRFAARSASLWRWAELLPIHDFAQRIDLGEGGTPLLHLDRLAAQLRLNEVWVKHGRRNPTRAFKGSSTSDPDTSNNSDSEDTTVYVVQADLSVTKSDDFDPVNDGEPLTYTIVVTNNGPYAAENVTLSDSLPAGMTFNFATITQGTCAIGFPLLQCQLGTMNAGDSVILTIRVTPDSPGIITNTVNVTSDTDDLDTSNNSDSEDTAVTARQADLSVTKDDDVDPVTEGEPLTYTIVVTNRGPYEAENVILSDSLPAGMIFNFATITQGTCAIGFPLLQCQLGTMNADTTKAK